MLGCYRRVLQHTSHLVHGSPISCLSCAIVLRCIWGCNFMNYAFLFTENLKLIKNKLLSPISSQDLNAQTTLLLYQTFEFHKNLKYLTLSFK